MVYGGERSARRQWIAPQQRRQIARVDLGRERGGPPPDQRHQQARVPRRQRRAQIGSERAPPLSVCLPPLTGSTAMAAKAHRVPGGVVIVQPWPASNAAIRTCRGAIDPRSLVEIAFEVLIQ